MLQSTRNTWGWAFTLIGLQLPHGTSRTPQSRGQFRPGCGGASGVRFKNPSTFCFLRLALCHLLSKASSLSSDFSSSSLLSIALYCIPIAQNHPSRSRWLSGSAPSLFPLPAGFRYVPTSPSTRHGIRTRSTRRSLRISQLPGLPPKSKRTFSTSSIALLLKSSCAHPARSTVASPHWRRHSAPERQGHPQLLLVPRRLSRRRLPLLLPAATSLARPVLLLLECLRRRAALPQPHPCWTGSETSSPWHSWSTQPAPPSSSESESLSGLSSQNC